ncbi:MAG: uroporphyrinogen-III C-methyltransferase [Mariprofundaceae bacterium]|nr:uroporphyrinogen-III C-methyltransferase [Mariprofundaceae bacterium]
MTQHRLASVLTQGEVALVGAGPGHPDLLTIAALKLLQACDVVVHDALVSEAILALVPTGITLINAGKRGGRPSTRQHDICETLVTLAQEKKRVVRLKGGDPFVFGRGGEEVRFLAQHHIPFRIIPGITSGIAAPAMAGIPVTDRYVNSSLAFLTGHEMHQDSRVDWHAMVQAFPVLVLYMSARTLPDIAQKLMDVGLSASTPIAAIHSATLDHEEQQTFTLEQAMRREVHVKSPSIVIIGDVVDMAVPWL